MKNAIKNYLQAFFNLMFSKESLDSATKAMSRNNGMW